MKKIRFLSVITAVVMAFSVFAAAGEPSGYTYSGVQTNLLPDMTVAATDALATSTPVVLGEFVFVSVQVTQYDASYNPTVKTTRLVKMSKDGRVVGQVELSHAAHYSIPIKSDGKSIYIGLKNGIVDCVDPQTMTVKWSSASAGAAIDCTTELALTETGVYFGVYGFANIDDGEIIGLDKTDGSKIFSADIAASFGTTPLIEGGKIYLADEKGRINIAQLSGSAPVKSVQVSSGAIRSGLTQNEGKLYFGDVNGEYFSLDMAGETFVSLGKSGKINRTTTAPMISGGNIYMFGEEYDPSGYGTVLSGQMNIVSLGDLSLKNATVLPNHTKSSPVMVSTGEYNEMYVVANYSGTSFENDGRLVMVRENKKTGQTDTQILYTPTNDVRNASSSSVVFSDDDNMYYTIDSGYMIHVSRVPIVKDPQTPEKEETTQKNENPPTSDMIFIPVMLAAVSGGIMKIALKRKTK